MNDDDAAVAASSAPDAEIARLQRRVERERAARKQAERIIEDKSRQLWEANKKLDEAVRRLDELATHDPLTGLCNRRGLEDWLRMWRGRIERTGTRVAVVSLDLDHFKAVNDSLGHAGGDELLQVVAQRLTQCARPTDVVVRLGGDELLVVLDAVHDIDDAVAVAERMHHVLTEGVTIGGVDIHPESSMGVALLLDGEDPAKAITRADKALYRAKQDGRGRIVADRS